MLQDLLNAVVHDDQNEVLHPVEAVSSTEREHSHVLKDHDTSTTHLLYDYVATTRMQTCHDLLPLHVSQLHLKAIPNRLNRHDLQSQPWHLLQIILALSQCANRHILRRITLHSLFKRWLSKGSAPQFLSALLIISTDDLHLAQAFGFFLRLLFILDTFETLAHWVRNCAICT